MSVFENRGLRRIFESKTEEETRACRKLLIERLIDMNCSPNIVWVIKQKERIWRIM
jgi:hypothetical protein